MLQHAAKNNAHPSDGQDVSLKVQTGSFASLIHQES